MTRKHQKHDTPEPPASPPPVTSNPNERRRDERHSADETPQLSARLVGGAAVKLLNISPRGCLLETNMALPPGRTVSLRFLALDADLVLSGCVVRSSVGSLTSSAIAYQTAISFGQENTLYTRLLAEASTPIESYAAGASDDADSDLMVVVSVARNIEGVRTMIGATA